MVAGAALELRHYSGVQPLLLDEIDGSLTVTDNGPGSPQVTTLTGYGVRDCYPTCPN